VIYETRQYGVLGIAGLAVTVVVVIAVGVGLDDPPAQLVCGLIALFFVVMGLLFMSLKVSVDDAHVRVSFGVGLIRKQIPIARIASVTPVRNRWWYGLGIRWTPHGWLWNIHGLRAVELVYVDGARFRLGTPDPEGLAAAITASGAASGAGPEGEGRRPPE